MMFPLFLVASASATVTASVKLADHTASRKTTLTASFTGLVKASTSVINLPAGYVLEGGDTPAVKATKTSVATDENGLPVTVSVADVTSTWETGDNNGGAVTLKIDELLKSILVTDTVEFSFQTKNPADTKTYEFGFEAPDAIAAVEITIYAGLEGSVKRASTKVDTDTTITASFKGLPTPDAKTVITLPDGVTVTEDSLTPTITATKKTGADAAAKDLVAAAVWDADKRTVTIETSDVSPTDIVEFTFGIKNPSESVEDDEFTFGITFGIKEIAPTAITAETQVCADKQVADVNGCKCTNSNDSKTVVCAKDDTCHFSGTDEATICVKNATVGSSLLAMVAFLVAIH